ncbi:MAG TPA: hypothetical protein VGB08_08850 [Allosphingosinicella sp.]|jgi:hypothetical protein
MNGRFVASLCLAAALAGCATSRRGPEEPEFVGRTLRVETAAGQASTLRFERDGTVIARFGEQETRGRWSLEPRELCFTWRQTFRECWPYTQPFRTGRTVPIRSDRGNAVQVTMLR